jgi:hypothetical protein
MDSSRSNANIRGTLLGVARRCWNFPRRVDHDLQRYDAMMILTPRTQDSKRAGRAHLATVVASAVAAALVGIGTGTGQRASSSTIESAITVYEKVFSIPAVRAMIESCDEEFMTLSPFNSVGKLLEIYYKCKSSAKME